MSTNSITAKKMVLAMNDPLKSNGKNDVICKITTKNGFFHAVGHARVPDTMITAFTRQHITDGLRKGASPGLTPHAALRSARRKPTRPFKIDCFWQADSSPHSERNDCCAPAGTPRNAPETLRVSFR